MRYTFAELEQIIAADPELRQGLLRILPVASFVRDCILPADFVFPDSFASTVVLTSEGEECANFLRTGPHAIAEADIRAILLGTTAYRELLVEPAQTDVDAIVSELSGQVASARIRYPFVYHRELYEKYFEVFGANSHPISAEETQALLDGSSQGVFQVCSLVSGPFGLLPSSETRYLPPTSSAPLAHCRDPGCPGIHPVACVTSPTAAGQGYRTLGIHLRESVGAPSEWRSLFIDLLRPDEVYYAPINSGNLPDLLGNALSDSELRTVFSALCDSPGAPIRAVLGTVAPLLAKTGADNFASGLSRAEMLQAIMLASDNDIIRTTEKAVTAGDIRVPVTEVRESRLASQSRSGASSQRAQLSRYGVRFNAKALGTLRLQDLVMRTHSEEELRWKLVGRSGTSTAEKVSDLVRSADVHDIVKDFLLDSLEAYGRSKEYLRFGEFREPRTAEERETLTNVVLWKLGFDVREYPELHRTFHRRSSVLSRELDEPIHSEIRVEAVRSAAVNFFVSLEEVLDQALSFSAFSLLLDHYGQPRWARFVFSLRRARNTMASWLDGGSRSAGSPLTLSASGKNNLFGLVHGFRELALLSEELLSSPERPIRDPATYPLWSRHEGLYKFPFVHTVPLFDVACHRIADIVECLKKVTNIFLSADLMGVRNRVPHGGGEFPSLQALQVARVAAEEAVDLLEQYGLAGLVHYPGESRSDGMVRGCRFYFDYSARRFPLYWPSVLDKCHLPSMDVPQMIFTHAAILGTSEVLRFEIEDDSDFTAMWADYPRLQAIDVGDAQASPLEKGREGHDSGVMAEPG